MGGREASEQEGKRGEIRRLVREKGGKKRGKRRCLITLAGDKRREVEYRRGEKKEESHLCFASTMEERKGGGGGDDTLLTKPACRDGTPDSDKRKRGGGRSISSNTSAVGGKGGEVRSCLHEEGSPREGPYLLIGRRKDDIPL